MVDQSINPPVKTKAVVCLAAGPSQLVVIRQAKTLGYFVVGVDRDEAACGLAECDLVLPLSTYEAGPIIARLQAEQKYGGALAGIEMVAVLNRSSGPPVITAALIGAAFGHDTVSEMAAITCVHKDVLRRFCSEQGIVAPFTMCLTTDEPPAEPDLSFPCVVKPALSLVGKKGVGIVTKAEDFPRAWAAAQAASETGTVLVEDYIPGHDVSVISVVRNGRVEILALLDEINELASSGAVAGKAMVVPSRFDGGLEAEKISRLTQEVADKLQLRNTPLFLSCRCRFGGDPVLVEIHLDLGGDLIVDVLLPAAGPGDVLGFIIASLAGEADGGLDEFSWTPTAVVFATGDELISEKPYSVHQAATRGELEAILKDVPTP